MTSARHQRYAAATVAQAQQLKLVSRQALQAAPAVAMMAAPLAVASATWAVSVAGPARAAAAPTGRR